MRYCTALVSVFSLQKCSKHQNGSDAPDTRYVTREVFESLSASRDEAVSKQPSAGHPHELVWVRFGLGAGTGEVRGHGMESQFRQRPLWDVHQVKFTAGWVGSTVCAPNNKGHGECVIKPRLEKKRHKEVLSVYSLAVFFLFPVSLPRFIVVPQKVLDTELKKSFAHFNEGRIPVSISSTQTLRYCPSTVLSDILFTKAFFK